MRLSGAVPRIAFKSGMHAWYIVLHSLCCLSLVGGFCGIIQAVRQNNIR
jgi:hypothetical protein